MAAYHTVLGGITVFFLEEEPIVVTGFLIWQPTIPVHQFTYQATGIYRAPATCGTLSQIPGSNCGCSHFASYIPACGCVSRFCLLLFTSILLESQFNTIHLSFFFSIKLASKRQKDEFSYIIFSPAYPINMNYRNSTSREHYFHREIKRKLSHPVFFCPVS